MSKRKRHNGRLVPEYQIPGTDLYNKVEHARELIFQNHERWAREENPNLASPYDETN